MSKGKILVVDDEPDLREILVDEFSFSEFETFQAENGQLGLKSFLENKPNAIVSDIRMPGGDGLTLAKEVKKIDPVGTKVFLITGYADVSVMDAFQVGVDGFFGKPFNLEDIRENVIRSIGSPEDRYLNRSESTANHVEVILQTSNWQNDLQTAQIPMARGGIFVALNKMAPLAKSLRTEEMVTLKAQGLALATCRVRWSLLESTTQMNGFGLEFLTMEAEFFQFYMKQTEMLKKAVYIPSAVAL